MRRIVAVNEKGIRLNQDHHNAVLTDDEVDLIRNLNDEGIGYNRLAKKFEVSKTLVAKICRFEIRNQTPAKFKTVTQE